MDIDLMLEAVQAERDMVANRLQEAKRVRSVLNAGFSTRGRSRHAASGLRHAVAHALSLGHARVIHEHPAY
ncbi:MAG TPA: hypothetical protein VFY79_05730 [Dehalococcoidia bacterium]|jgi:hypothetical protein|nr:hypothetical protein [Dehalococcoidia bacterium]